MAADREKFIKLAENRTRKALKDIRLIANLSNRNAYVYSEKDVESIFGALEAELRGARRRFHDSSSAVEAEFTLN